MLLTHVIYCQTVPVYKTKLSAPKKEEKRVDVAAIRKRLEDERQKKEKLERQKKEKLERQKKLSGAPQSGKSSVSVKEKVSRRYLYILSV